MLAMVLVVTFMMVVVAVAAEVMTIMICCCLHMPYMERLPCHAPPAALMWSAYSKYPPTLAPTCPQHTAHRTQELPLPEVSSMGAHSSAFVPRKHNPASMELCRASVCVCVCVCSRTPTNCLQSGLCIIPRGIKSVYASAHSA